MGSATPKALMPLGGKALVRRSVETLHATGRFAAIVVLAPHEKIQDFTALFADIDLVRVLPGGAERQASVAAGIAFVGREMPNIFAGGSILVHDAARCLVTPEVIERCLRAHEDYRAVSAAVENVDTLVRGDGTGRVVESLDRRGVFAIQTPQVFDAALLRDAHARSSGGATDDASLVAPFEAIHLVDGDRSNIKMTSPADLRLGELILHERER